MRDSFDSSFMDGAGLFPMVNKVQSVIGLMGLIKLAQEKVVLHGSTKSDLDELSLRCYTFQNIFSAAVDIRSLKNEMINVCNGIGISLERTADTLYDTGEPDYMKLGDRVRKAGIETLEFLEFLRKVERRGSAEQFLVCFMVVAIVRNLSIELDDDAVLA